jgi:hypothetical protein
MCTFVTHVKKMQGNVIILFLKDKTAAENAAAE